MVDKTKGNTKHPIPVQKVVAETGKAFLIQFDDGQELWMPKSQCWLQIMVPEWLIDQKGLKPMGGKTGPVYGERQQSMYEADDDDGRPF